MPVSARDGIRQFHSFRVREILVLLSQPFWPPIPRRRTCLLFLLEFLAKPLPVMILEVGERLEAQRPQVTEERKEGRF